MTIKRFEVYGGEVITNRKPDWPDALYLLMPRYEAWSIARKLLNALEDEGELIGLQWVGEFTDMPDEAVEVPQEIIDDPDRYGPPYLGDEAVQS